MAPGLINGTTKYGENLVTGLKQEEKVEQLAVKKLSDEQDHVLKSFRLLIADLCQQFNGGHPGYAQFQDSCRRRADGEKQRSHWHGSNWRCVVEVCDAVCATHTDILQPRQIRFIKW